MCNFKNMLLPFLGAQPLSDLPEFLWLHPGLAQDQTQPSPNLGKAGAAVNSPLAPSQLLFFSFPQAISYCPGFYLCSPLLLGRKTFRQLYCLRICQITQLLGAESPGLNLPANLYQLPYISQLQLTYLVNHGGGRCWF